MPLRPLMYRWLLAYWLLFTSLFSSAQQHILKVHFLHGSKPAADYKDQEEKWFGGIMGGHVGIQLDEDSIFSFVPEGSFHVVGKREQPHGRFRHDDWHSFYGMFGTDAGEVRRTIIYIPVDDKQMALFAELRRRYLAQTPYDYALFGMRCAAAAYDVLDELNIVPNRTHSATFASMFYPQRLRRKLLAMAEENGWKVEREEGTERRVWERD